MVMFCLASEHSLSPTLEVEGILLGYDIATIEQSTLCVSSATDRRSACNWEGDQQRQFQEKLLTLILSLAKDSHVDWLLTQVTQA